MTTIHDIVMGPAIQSRACGGCVACCQVLVAAGGMNYPVALKAGVELPIRNFPLQAMVTQPLKPFLHTLVSSVSLHTYLVQTDRGEVVIGGGSDPYQLYSTRSTLDMKEHLAAGAVHLFPFLQKVPVLRQWAGITARSWGQARCRTCGSTAAGAPGGSRPRRLLASGWPKPSPPAACPTFFSPSR